jgi:hypothetical protein
MEDEPMTRQAIDGTLSPFRFALGQPIYAADLAAVAAQLAYAGARCPEHLAGGGSGNTGWGTASSPEAGNVTCSSNTASTVYEFKVWVDPDLQSVQFAARADVPAGTTITVAATVGSATITRTFTGATTPADVSSGTALVSATGSGLLDCSIVVQRTAGSGTGTLLAWSLHGLPIANADIPAPPNE